MNTGTTTRAFEVKPGSSVLGAEVYGLDLSRELDAAAFKDVEDLFHEHQMLVFRDQKITPDSLLGFSKRWGPVDHHVLAQYQLPGYPEIILISNIVENGRHIGLPDAGAKWHTDTIYTKTPSRTTILYALEVPTENGEPRGDTLFASTVHAYDALPEAMKKRLAGLKAIQCYRAKYEKENAAAGGKRAPLTEEQLKATPEVEHPLIRTHPATGRKCIYLSEGYTVGIVGMPDDEAQPLIAELAKHIPQPQFVHAHKWRVGDLVMWDNCSTQHNAVQDYKLPQRRLMQRTTVQGGVPF